MSHTHLIGRVGRVGRLGAPRSGCIADEDVADPGSAMSSSVLRQSSNASCWLLLPLPLRIRLFLPPCL